MSPDGGRLRAAERDLRLSEQRLRTLFDSIDEGYCLCEMVLDLDGKPVDYRFLEVNPLFERMTGLVDPVGRTALELVPDLEPTWVETYARVGVGGETLRFEQGSEAMGRWFDVFAVPLEPRGHFAIVFKDQTARHQVEEELRQSEERFRLLADRLPVLVWQHDAEGRQTWVNETYCSYFGVTREEMRDDRWHALPHPEDAPGYAERFARAVADRAPFHAEVRALAGTGEWRWLECWAQPVLHADGSYLGHLGTSADVTDRKRLEEAARVRHRRAELVADLMATIGREADRDAQLTLMARALVPEVADRAVIEAPGLLIGAGPGSDGRPGDRAQVLSRLEEPLALGDGVPGTLVLERTDAGRSPLGPAEQEFLRFAARRAEVALAAAHLRRREHDISARLQRALLPDQLLQHPRLAIAARYAAAGDLLEVGGDWYDTFGWPDGRIGAIVGDVVGHNLDSAAAMGRIRAATAALAPNVPPSPAAVLDALERFARGRDGSSFVTAGCVVVDPGTGALAYSSAGHPPPLVLAPGRPAEFLRGALAPPMCTAPSPVLQRPEATVVLPAGSLVVLYSDGLVERRREGLDGGMERLRQRAAEVADRPVDEVADHLVGTMATDAAREDDIVIVCLRYAG